MKREQPCKVNTVRHHRALTARCLTDTDSRDKCALGQKCSPREHADASCYVISHIVLCVTWKLYCKLQPAGSDAWDNRRNDNALRLGVGLNDAIAADVQLCLGSKKWCNAWQEVKRWKTLCPLLRFSLKWHQTCQTTSSDCPPKRSTQIFQISKFGVFGPCQGL